MTLTCMRTALVVTGASAAATKTVGDIDIDSLSLEGTGKHFTTDETSQLDALEKQRRDVDRELSIVREQLQQAMLTEVFNDKTGVGETKYGLPLGFINVQLLALEDVNIRDEDGIVVISVRSTKGDPQPPGPPPKHSNPGKMGTSATKSLPPCLPEQRVATGVRGRGAPLPRQIDPFFWPLPLATLMIVF